MKYIATATLTMLLAGCQSPSGAAAPVSKADTCGAQSRQHLVGTLADDLDKSTLPDKTRILHPNTPATMDYRLERLNILVDESGKIESVHCG